MGIKLGHPERPRGIPNLIWGSDHIIETPHAEVDARPTNTLVVSGPQVIQRGARR